jgi:glycosyltransferase involved in cell wall biosynthesis
VTRRGELLLFFDLPYAEGPGGVHCQDAFWIFLAELARGFERAAVLGRVRSGADAPRYRCGEGESLTFHRLPHYSSDYALGEVLRGVPGLVARAWGPIGRCDSLLLGVPSVWSLVLFALAKLRGKRVAFLARQDTRAYVRERAPARRRRLTLLAARALEAVFAALSRWTPAFAVGEAVASRQRATAILVSTVREREIAPEVTRAPSHSPARRLLWVGRLDREKRPGLLLETFRALCDRRTEALELDVAGEGPLRAETEALAKRLGLWDRVRFHGYVPHGPELAALYRAADLLVHSSAAEGFPQVILEAMASGVPVVASAAGGIPFALTDGANALLAPIDDAGALAAAAERALADPQLRARLSAGGLAFARAHTLERESARLLGIWDSLSRRTRPR